MTLSHSQADLCPWAECVNTYGLAACTCWAASFPPASGTGCAQDLVVPEFTYGSNSGSPYWALSVNNNGFVQGYTDSTYGKNVMLQLQMASHYVQIVHTFSRELVLKQWHVYTPYLTGRIYSAATYEGLLEVSVALNGGSKQVLVPAMDLWSYLVKGTMRSVALPSFTSGAEVRFNQLLLKFTAAYSYAISSAELFGLELQHDNACPSSLQCGGQWVCEIGANAVYNCVSPTPTRSPSPTTSVTPSASSTTSITDSPTTSPTISLTPTPANSPGVSPTSSLSITPTISLRLQLLAHVIPDVGRQRLPAEPDPECRPVGYLLEFDSTVGTGVVGNATTLYGNVPSLAGSSYGAIARVVHTFTRKILFKQGRMYAVTLGLLGHPAYSSSAGILNVYVRNSTNGQEEAVSYGNTNSALSKSVKTTVGFPNYFPYADFFFNQLVVQLYLQGTAGLYLIDLQVNDTNACDGVAACAASGLVCQLDTFGGYVCVAHAQRFPRLRLHRRPPARPTLTNARPRPCASGGTAPTRTAATCAVAERDGLPPRPGVQQRRLPSFWSLVTVGSGTAYSRNDATNGIGVECVGYSGADSVTIGRTLGSSVVLKQGQTYTMRLGLARSATAGMTVAGTLRISVKNTSTAATLSLSTQTPGVGVGTTTMVSFGSYTPSADFAFNQLLIQHWGSPGGVYLFDAELNNTGACTNVAACAASGLLCQLDTVGGYVCSSPSPSRSDSPSVSATPSSSLTPSTSLTSSISVSASSTLSVSSTATTSGSVTASNSVTASRSVTLTPSASPSRSPCPRFITSASACSTTLPISSTLTAWSTSYLYTGNTVTQNADHLYFVVSGCIWGQANDYTTMLHSVPLAPQTLRGAVKYGISIDYDNTAASNAYVGVDFLYTSNFVNSSFKVNTWLPQQAGRRTSAYNITVTLPQDTVFDQIKLTLANDNGFAGCTALQLRVYSFNVTNNKKINSKKKKRGRRSEGKIVTNPTLTRYKAAYTARDIWLRLSKFWQPGEDYDDDSEEG
eukprot:g36374.t1